MRAMPTTNYRRGVLAISSQSILLICLGLVIFGCAAPFNIVVKQYQGAPICCTSMSEFQYEMLHIGDSQSFDLNEKSDAFLFATGKSYFKAFELPQGQYPFQVLIKSYIIGDHIASAYIFHPHILTLNEKYDVVRSTDSSSFCFKKSGFWETLKETRGVQRILEGFVSFTEENSNEKYLVILTTESLLQKKIHENYRTIIPIILPGMVMALPGMKATATIPASPVGHVKVTVIRGIP